MLRERIFKKIKNETHEEKIQNKLDAEMEHCTFAPDTLQSRRAVLNGEDQEVRDLYGFLSDQQRFLEYKSMKQLKSKQD